jgi:hypothetical protein
VLTFIAAACAYMFAWIFDLRSTWDDS